MLSVPYCAVGPKVSLPVRPIKATVLTNVISMVIFINTNSSSTIETTSATGREAGGDSSCQLRIKSRHPSHEQNSHYSQSKV